VNGNANNLLNDSSIGKLSVLVKYIGYEALFSSNRLDFDFEWSNLNQAALIAAQAFGDAYLLKRDSNLDFAEKLASIGFHLVLPVCRSE
jgi:hypothetical protein